MSDQTKITWQVPEAVYRLCKDEDDFDEKLGHGRKERQSVFTTGRSPHQMSVVVACNE